MKTYRTFVFDSPQFAPSTGGYGNSPQRPNVEAPLISPSMQNLLEFQRIRSEALPVPPVPWSGDFIEDFVDPDSLGFAPPISTQEVVLHLKTYTSNWPSLDLDEVDLELFEV